MARSWTFGKKIAAGFALSFVLLAAIGAIAYRSIDALSQTSYSVAHTHVALERIASVLSLLKDAETDSEATSSPAMRAFSGLIRRRPPRSRQPSTTSGS
jgi:hypothetical protein